MNSGGAQRVVANLANQFVDQGHQVRIITFMDGDAYELNNKIDRLRFHKSYLIKRVLLNSLIHLFRFYKNKNNRPDIISAHIGMIGFSTIPIAKLYKIKIIVSEHFNHFLQKRNFLRILLWDYLYKYADAVTVLTNKDLPYFSKRNSRTIVMENPCSFEPTMSLGSNREKIILAVGDLNRYEHKGFDNLIKVMSKVLPKHLDWKLKIVGEGKIGKEFLINLIKKYDLADNVELTGFRSDIKDLMNNSEIFILSSRYEGLPMVLLEALSQGMACIAFDCVTGPAEIIEDGVNGFLVEDQNNAEMVMKLNDLMENDDKRNLFRNNASKSLDKFSIQNVSLKWNTLFDQIVK